MDVTKYGPTQLNQYQKNYLILFVIKSEILLAIFLEVIDLRIVNGIQCLITNYGRLGPYLEFS